LWFSAQKVPHAGLPLVQLSQRQPTSSVVETVSAAIASDPNFTAALVAAISSIIATPKGSDGNNSNDGSNNGNGVPESPQLPQSCTTFSTN
jgi:hypothetical protein